MHATMPRMHGSEAAPIRVAALTSDSGTALSVSLTSSISTRMSMLVQAVGGVCLVVLQKSI